MREPGSPPFPDRPAGSDSLPGIEHKWNLPALTRRDAAATPLTDFIDLSNPPQFKTPAPLPRPAIWPFTGVK